MITPEEAQLATIRNQTEEQLTMITRDEIAKLPAKGRTALFDDLSALLFPTLNDCATGLDVTRGTVYNWRKKDDVPLMALYALHSMAEATLATDLADIAAKLERVTLILERIISPAGDRRETVGSADTTATACAKASVSAK
jgi:hypothetical protein